ncbi:sulfurase [Rhodoferax koreense]|uniref:Sulfurase n=1 Tax=Rhodoferax koreensis TaxID=1842727 RepID=A0A1P8K4Y8_9BURK|nr:MOSC domain-containing protein [Rhodoferax koreense]APW40991.1 sulfurase [Rhodoferax koreense]
MPDIQLLGIQVGTARPLRAGHRKVSSAIGKTAVDGPLLAGPLGLAGDMQADLAVHGGPDKAVYAYPAAHYAFWRQQRLDHGASLFDETLPHGFVGENLSIDGLLEDAAFIGDELHFPQCTLRITAPREPCFKFNAVMGFSQAAKAMVQSGRCGFYLAVTRPGPIAAGETARLVTGPRRTSVALAFAASMARRSL